MCCLAHCLFIKFFISIIAQKWILTAKLLQPLTKDAIFDQSEDAGARVTNKVLLSQNYIAQIRCEDWKPQNQLDMD